MATAAALFGPFVPPARPLADAAAGIRLRLWTPMPADAKALAAAWADPDLALGGRPPADTSVAGAGRWLRLEPERRRRGAALDLVAGPSSGGPEVLGEVGLRNLDRARGRAEISWWTAPEHRGRGVASAAARLLADWALSPAAGLTQVWCRIDGANRASAAVATAAGLSRLGTAAGVEVWARTPPAPARPPSGVSGARSADQALGRSRR